MKDILRDIKPGVGLGKIKFGMTRDEVRKLIGEPDEIDKFSYSSLEEELTESWEYEELGLTLGFDEEDNWRLVMISVFSSFYKLNGKKLIDQPRGTVEAILEELQLGEISFEDHSAIEFPNHHMLEIKDRSINFWFDDGILEEIQWSPEFIDDDTIEWPE